MAIERDTMSASLPDLIDSDPFPSMLSYLKDIRDALRGIVAMGEQEWPFDGSTTGAMQAGATWERLRVSYLVFSTIAAATVTLTIGTRTRVFSVPAADTRIVPLPIVIERGMTVTLTGSGGVVTGHLVATPE